ncbi:hypothetical protein [Phenylobacterium sp.]|jgi:hypothetical protein|uniref:hypothetical protein n=1 Tax=Phenylobacterium sp. TaxID=1871053 RepID=UPI002F4015BA
MTNSISKIAGPLALAAAMAAGGAARAEADPPQAEKAQADRAPVVARTEQCLRQKVDRVVADEPDIAAAANFLIGFACADEIAGATRYMRNTAYVQLFGMLGALGKAASTTITKGAAPGAPPPLPVPPSPTAANVASAVLAQLSVDPQTGDIVLPIAKNRAASPINASLSQFSTILGQFMPETTPVSLRKLAGDLVLEARERRRAK